MNQKDNGSEQLKELLDTYEFSMDTLSKYLQLPANQIKKFQDRIVIKIFEYYDQVEEENSVEADSTLD